MCTCEQLCESVTDAMAKLRCLSCQAPGNNNECVLYGTSQKIIMNSKLSSHSSVGLNSSMLWIIGGKGTEFVTTEMAVNGPTLPEPVYWHCSVLFPGNGNVYLIGGYHGDFGTLVGCFKNKLKSEGECINCIWVGLVLHYRRAPSLTYNNRPWHVELLVKFLAIKELEAFINRSIARITVIHALIINDLLYQA